MIATNYEKERIAKLLQPEEASPRRGIRSAPLPKTRYDHVHLDPKREHDHFLPPRARSPSRDRSPHELRSPSPRESQWGQPSLFERDSPPLWRSPRQERSASAAQSPRERESPAQFYAASLREAAERVAASEASADLRVRQFQLEATEAKAKFATAEAALATEKVASAERIGELADELKTVRAAALQTNPVRAIADQPRPPSVAEPLPPAAAEAAAEAASSVPAKGMGTSNAAATPAAAPPIDTAQQLQQLNAGLLSVQRSYDDNVRHLRQAKSVLELELAEERTRSERQREEIARQREEIAVLTARLHANASSSSSAAPPTVVASPAVERSPAGDIDDLPARVASLVVSRALAVHEATAGRRTVLLLKGLVFGIPDTKFEEALHRASQMITSGGVTTVCWDGDKYTYPGADGKAPTASFTRLLPMLHERFPHLECVFFKKVRAPSPHISPPCPCFSDLRSSAVFVKKVGKARGLISGGEVAPDEHGNVLGPVPFLTDTNTRVINAAAALPPVRPDQHYGVEFDDISKWYELGLKVCRGAQCRPPPHAESPRPPASRTHPTLSPPTIGHDVHQGAPRRYNRRCARARARWRRPQGGREDRRSAVRVPRTCDDRRGGAALCAWIREGSHGRWPGCEKGRIHVSDTESSIRSTDATCEARSARVSTRWPDGKCGASSAARRGAQRRGETETQPSPAPLQPGPSNRGREARGRTPSDEL